MTRTARVEVNDAKGSAASHKQNIGRSVCSPNITLVAAFGLRLCFRPGYMLGTVLRAAQCAACLDAPRLQPRWCWPSFTSSHGPRQPRWDVSSTRRWSSGPSSSAPYFHGCTLFRPGNGDVHAPGCSSGSARRPVGARKQRTSTNSSAGTEPWRSGRGGRTPAFREGHLCRTKAERT